ncbi:glyoxylate reductase/hydroxypyruvate reductase-like [Liolophura sinensis]|uniref:glyoxylate reductase/hydroxypyruvate reductase-like n=1 Tax=Liolophura sinensis TaxID=3198878 RepID=UPI0031581794
MSSEKPAILAWETADTDREVGIPQKYVELLRQHFDVVWEKDVKANYNLGSKVVGAIVTADRPIPIMFDHPKLFPNLRVVVTLSAGLDHLDLSSLRARGIRLAATASFANAVAEITLTLLLSLTRDIGKITKTIYEPSLRQSRLAWDSPGISDSTVGLVGFGRIGVRTAQLLRPHDCRICYFDPHVRRSHEEDREMGVTRYRDLCEMLRDSDAVIVACTLTPDTIGLIGETEFAAMKPSATFINVARGKLVDTYALTRALQSGGLRSAGLDVVHPDWLPTDHPLLTMDNVLLVPHCAAATLPALDFAFKSLISNLLTGLSGEVMPKEVDLEHY